MENTIWKKLEDNTKNFKENIKNFMEMVSYFVNLVDEELSLLEQEVFYNENKYINKISWVISLVNTIWYLRWQDSFFSNIIRAPYSDELYKIEDFFEERLHNITSYLAKSEKYESIYKSKIRDYFYFSRTGNFPLAEDLEYNWFFWKKKIIYNIDNEDYNKYKKYKEIEKNNI